MKGPGLEQELSAGTGLGYIWVCMCMCLLEKSVSYSETTCSCPSQTLLEGRLLGSRSGCVEGNNCQRCRSGKQRARGLKSEKKML